MNNPPPLGRLLVVDDEPELLNALVEMLAREGYQATGFDSAAKALEALGEREFDVLLTDLRLPGLDGIGLLRAGLEIDPNLVGILMTGHGTVKAAVEAMQVGAFDFVLKPFQLSAILPILARALDVRRLRLDNLQLRETVAIYELTQAITHTLDLNTILNKTADAALQQCEADEASIMLPTPDGQALVVAAVRGEQRGPLLGTRLPLGQGIAGWVAREHNPLTLLGEVHDPRFAPLYPRPEIKSAVSIPMLSGDQLIGVLNVNLVKGQRQFSPGQVKALTVLVSTAAAALENARLHAQVQATEQRLRAVIENSSDGIALVDAEGQPQYVGPALSRILGYGSIEALTSANVWPELVHPEDMPAISAQMRDALGQPGQVLTGEYRFQHQNGAWRWLHVSLNNLLDNPSVGALVINYRDITDRKQTEAALTESNAQFRTLFEASPDAIMLIDPNGSWPILDCNAAACRMNGYTRDELVGQSVDVLNLTSGSPAERAHYLEQIRQTNVVYVETAHRRKDGTIFPIEVSTSLITLNGREVVLGIDRDITERKQAQETVLLQSTALNSAANGVVITNLDGTIEWVNPAFSAMTGYTAGEVIGRNPRDLLKSGKQDAAFYKNMWETILAGKVWHGDIINRRKDGSLYTEEQTITPFADPDGKVTHFIGIKQDVTERKRAQEEINWLARFPSENPGPVLRVTRDGIILYANAGSRPLLSLWACDTGGRLPEAVGQMVAESYAALTSCEAEYVAGGEAYSVIFAPVADGEYVNIYGRDVTQRKEAEAALAQSKDLLARAEQIGHIGSWSWDIPADRVIWSDGLYGVFGLAKEGFGATFEGYLERVHPDDRERVRQAIERAVREHGTFETESRIVLPGGEARVLATRGELQLDAHGQPLRLVGIGIDITERKQAEALVQRHLTRLAALRAIDLAISASLDLGLTLQIVLDQVIAELQVDAADVYLVNASRHSMDYTAGRGLSSKTTPTARLRLGQSYAGQVALERRALHLPDLNLTADKVQPPAVMLAEGFQAYYAQPLIAKGLVVGVLEVFRRKPLPANRDWLDFLEALAGQAAIAIDNATLFGDLQKSNQDLNLAYDATIEGWGKALDLRDHETEGHSQRVTDLTLQLAARMGVEPAQMVHIRRGALLHDIGKMGVPDNVLLKPGPLSDDEWVIMRQHPVYAHDLLSPIRYLREALDIPYCHHEKWDGSGYPRQLKAEAIPLAARIFAVVDVWDALGSNRPYRPAWPDDSVRGYLRAQTGQHFDPAVVEAFEALMDES